MQVHGRYSDTTPYGFMDKMGIWFENFALPVIVNECLMQSYDGTIRMFPNWPMDKDAEFYNIRATGAFLVSSSLKNGKVNKLQVTSEVGGILKIILPWKTGGAIIRQGGKKPLTSNVVDIQTVKGEIIDFQP